ncbi:1-acyl-sn-glycerol-3-phosphate acyltransferase [Sanguibacter sp. Z1732]|uniref:1-acyl-sn-glycerol-3-phosphate acyltransferase n=1 Tax=Sanguibacter sp. Z1732 TaxID=3435412 RepID=UPI003D9C9462
MRAARRTDRYHWAWHRWARYVAQRLILRPIVFSTTRVTVTGEGNLEGLRPPFVVVANHSSHLDAPLVITALPWRVTRHLATAVAADYFYRQAWRRTLTSFFFNSYPVERGRGKKREAGLSGDAVAREHPAGDLPRGHPLPHR